MPNQRLSQDKRALVLAALCEGTPINAVTRITGVAKETILRTIQETGEALADYMDKEFRDLPVARIEIDEQWQYVGEHGQRMDKEKKKANPEKGDYWLWCAIDPDTKLVFSHLVDRRSGAAGDALVADVASRVRDTVQITTDNHRSYGTSIMEHFGYFGANYGTETKIFGESGNLNDWNSRRKNGVPKVATATREVVFGSPDLGSCTTSHIERVFLSVRQECTRFTRCTLAYSKTLKMHRASVALYFGVYNLVRRHKGVANFTPAMAAGLASKRWTLLDVVQMSDAYWKPILAARVEQKAKAKRVSEDDVFLKALAESGL